MKKYYLILFIFFPLTESAASIKSNIIKNLQNINNISFDFEQNINGKIEDGNCIIEYPKKIFCKYNLKNKKVLVSNGNSLVIKTQSSYYLYPLEKTSLNLILNKEFLITKISNLKDRIIEDKFINYNFTENDNEINIFFDNETFNLVGWKTRDIYQNTSMTYLFSLEINKKISKNLFNIPNQN